MTDSTTLVVSATDAEAALHARHTGLFVPSTVIEHDISSATPVEMG